MTSSKPPAQPGYTFYPARYPHSPGSPRLDVVLSRSISLEAKPEAKSEGFHPLRAFFPVRTEDGGIQDLEIYSPWMAEQSFQVCAGRLRLADPSGNEVEAYTFGGQLEVNPGEDFTRCILESNAPILSLHRERPFVGQLADECEILLAERRAAWLGDEDRFQERLAATPAEMLYPACLEALLEKFKRLPRLGDQPAADDLYQFIGGEIHAMQAAGLWPTELLPLEQIL